MKHITKAVFFFSVICNVMGSNSFAQKPTLDITASKRVITLDDEKPEDDLNGKKPDAKKAAELAKQAQELADRTKVQMKIDFVSNGMTPRSYYWSISGIQGEDWILLNGNLSKEASGDGKVQPNSGNLELDFKKIGSYYVSFSVNYVDEKKKKKDQQIEDLQETEITVEYESFITVTNNLDELTQLHADSNFVKLVKRAGDYSVKDKYANDPTPYIFLAKGLYGIYRKDLKVPNIQEPLDEAVEACAVAIERDANGVFNMPVHKMWLNGFQLELLNNGIRYILDETDGYPTMYSNSDKVKTAETLSEMLDACESYSSITRNPMGIKFIEAAIRYNNKDSKTANLIWKTEIPNLLQLSDKAFESWTQADKDALRTGLILSSQCLEKRDGSSLNARPICKKAEKWFEYDKDWIAFYEKAKNSFEPK